MLSLPLHPQAMGIADAADEEPLTGTVEADETYFGRNSIASEIEATYVEIARQRITRTARQHRLVGAIEAEVILDKLCAATRTPAPDGIPATL